MVAVADFEVEAVFAVGESAAAADGLAGGYAAAGAGADLGEAGVDAEVAVAVVDDNGVAVALQGGGVGDFAFGDAAHGGGRGADEEAFPGAAAGAGLAEAAADAAAGGAMQAALHAAEAVVLRLLGFGGFEGEVFGGEGVAVGGVRLFGRGGAGFVRTEITLVRTVVFVFR